MSSREVDYQHVSALQDVPRLVPHGHLAGRGRLWTPKGEGAGGAPRREAALNNRIETLRVLLQALMDEVESLRETSESEAVEGLNLSEEVRRYEAHLIRCALIRTGGRQRRAARLLKTKVSTLNAKIKRYGLEVD
jgi:DNA-binding protein Fis